MKHATRCTMVVLAFAALGRTDAPVAPSTKPAETRSSDGRLEASIALVGSTTAPAQFRPGEAVNVRFTVKNTSKEPLAIWRRNCSWISDCLLPPRSFKPFVDPQIVGSTCVRCGTAMRRYFRS